MTTLLGSVGLTLLLSAFVLNQTNRLSPDSKWYNILNIIGGFLLTYYAWVLGSIPFLILEAAWALFASYKLIQLWSKKQ